MELALDLTDAAQVVAIDGNSFVVLLLSAVDDGLLKLLMTRLVDKIGDEDFFTMDF